MGATGLKAGAGRTPPSHPKYRALSVDSTKTVNVKTADRQSLANLGHQCKPRKIHSSLNTDPAQNGVRSL